MSIYILQILVIWQLAFNLLSSIYDFFLFLNLLNGIDTGCLCHWSLKFCTSRAASNAVVFVGRGKNNTQVLGPPRQEPFCFDPFYKLGFVCLFVFSKILFEKKKSINFWYKTLQLSKNKLVFLIVWSMALYVSHLQVCLWYLF